MKYLVVLGDGMADLPIAELGGKTPLAFAATPNMDALAGMGRQGMVQTVPPGMQPGSDVANLAVLGYDPLQNYSGRSPLEALSVGVAMEKTDAVFRCNLVTLTEGGAYTDKTILDHSAGEISTQEADALMDAVRRAFDTEQIRFYTGTSYRHICLWKNGPLPELIAPHDHLGAVIGPFLPQEPILRRMMEQSYEILNTHPVNLERAARGEAKANSLWFWGPGRKPALGSFREKTGLRGAMISAVDLLKGIAVGTQMRQMRVEGATGSLHTNYEGKADAAIRALKEENCDFVYIHVEAPDEMGHQGDVQSKVRAIEYLDSRLIGRLRAAMDAWGEPYKLMILPDHPTPVCIRTHTAEPVPYLIYDSTRQRRRIGRYSEADAAATGIFEPEGHRLLAKFLELEEEML